MFDFFSRFPDFTADDAARLRRVEQKLDLILSHLGIDYEELVEVFPERPRLLADQGQKIAAIKAYRELTGAGLAEAKNAVENYLGRRTG